MESVKRSDEYAVYFGHTWPEAAAARSVLVRPLGDRWNDFNFRTRVTCEVRSDGASFEPFEAYLGFLGEDEPASDATYVTDLLASKGSPLAAEDIPRRFFTMLATMAEYRKLVDALGPKQARLPLSSLNDLVATTEFSPTTQWLDEALSSDVFNMSFLRSSESFFTFKNAGPLLRGAQYEEFNVASTSLAVELPRDDAPAVDLRFEFDHDGVLPKRMAVVIGKNGVGKSQTLRQIAETALAREETLRDASGERFVFSRLLAFAPTNEAEQVFPVVPADERMSGTAAIRSTARVGRGETSTSRTFSCSLPVQTSASVSSRDGRSSSTLLRRSTNGRRSWFRFTARGTYLPLTGLRQSGRVKCARFRRMHDRQHAPASTKTRRWRIRAQQRRDLVPDIRCPGLLGHRERLSPPD